MKEPDFKIEKQEEERKYELPEENIIACGEDSEIRIKNKDYFKGLKEEGIEWPVEFQGSSFSDFKKKELKIYYPEGDVFISFAITFHEVGHFRQGEIDERFSVETLGAPEPKIDDDTINHHESESDAWERGFERIKKYCPEELRIIEGKFQEYKKKGKFQEHDSFEDYYRHIVKVGLKITEFNDRVERPDKKDKRRKGKLIGKMIKKDDFANKFFTKQEDWKAGEKIDKNLAEGIIKKAVKGIAEEKYNN